MESSLPKCKCGADVHVDYYLEPSYDDGGSIDAVDYVQWFAETCLNCSLVEPHVMHNDEDELPF